MIVRRIGVWSAAKIAGLTYAVLGLFGGLFFALLSMVGAGMAMATQYEDIPAWFAPMFGVGALFIFPVLYGVMGLLMGAVFAALYNLFSGFVGGLELEVVPTGTTGSLKVEG